MKIAFLAGANSIHSVRWVKFFTDKGHEIVWLSFAPPIPEAKELVKRTKFYEITPSPLTDINGLFAPRYLPSAVKQIKDILQKEKPDLLHVHSAGTYGFTAALANFHPTVLTPWGSDILLGSFVRKLVLIFIVDRADVYTCDGENTFERLIGLGADREKIHLIRFGTDVEKFRPGSSVKSQMLKVKVVSLRNLEPIYNIETLIRAAAIVIKSAPNTKFVLAGGGTEREFLENLSKELNIQKNVQFLGQVNNEKLPVLLQSANVYVSTALSDSGLSASTAEAMASSLPVVATDTGDSKDWIDNEFIIPVKSPEALAEKITTLIDNVDLRKKQGIRNRQIIKEKNNYYTEMEKTEKIYEEIIKKNKKSGR